MKKLPLKTNDYRICENNFHKNWMNFYLLKSWNLVQFSKMKKNQKNWVSFLIMFPKPKPMVFRKNWKPPNNSLQEMNINISLCSQLPWQYQKIEHFSQHIVMFITLVLKISYVGLTPLIKVQI
jgi:hypothetical protein